MQDVGVSRRCREPFEIAYDKGSEMHVSENKVVVGGASCPIKFRWVGGAYPEYRNIPGGGGELI